MLSAYAENHHRCAVCWWPRHRPGRWLEIHHIAGRVLKGHHNHKNLLMLCNRCHDAVHIQLAAPYNTLTRGCILTAKREEDGRVYLKFLAQLRGRQWLGYDPEPIPEVFLQERIENAR